MTGSLRNIKFYLEGTLCTDSYFVGPSLSMLRFQSRKDGIFAHNLIHGCLALILFQLGIIFDATGTAEQSAAPGRGGTAIA